MFILLFLTPIGRWKKFRGNDEAEQMKKMHTFLVGIGERSLEAHSSLPRQQKLSDETGKMNTTHAFPFIVMHELSTIATDLRKDF